MRMLVNREAPASLPFDLAAVKLHMRVDGAEEDAAITNMGRTAAAEFEQLAQVALLTQTVQLTIIAPEGGSLLSLPIGPAQVENVPAVAIDGVAFTDFDFIGGGHPLIIWGDSYADLSPELIVVEYQSGFGAAASDIPAEIAQAIMDQAALHYDGRSPMDAESLTSSPHMARAAARYRGVQL
ncbi:head-tail connector protein [Pseudodonghicola flavimaris]|uniref:Phage gp6-like head-tail connector protein n=1 Tax=Pseudodonghicola flavimaris TaxID=3050036 RepID=A0ABT7F5F7_9RHOB|nr:hypothetical protein [Pseudodonghicola flavimaris]MDK3019634.1 hypothetical protein [Pseudodonghicola flavimaris]